jgi:hypothetical protein
MTERSREVATSRLMCNAWSGVWILAVGFGLASLCVSIVTSTRFRQRLETLHPATWRWMGTWKFRAIDCDPAEAAIGEFIWSGMYKSLDDPVLDGLVRRMIFTGVLCILSVAVLFLANWQSPSSSLFACLRLA